MKNFSNWTLKTCLPLLAIVTVVTSSLQAATPELYEQYCASCHGAAGQGSTGIPGLTDRTWQYGGSLEEIERSIKHGRQSTMPALGFALGAGIDETGLNQVVVYVRSLSGPTDVASDQLAAGEILFTMFCASCHGESGTGTQSLGAPDLSDAVWLYGGDATTIRDVIHNGRSNSMPGFEALLNEEETHALAVYVQRMNLDAQ